MRDLLSIGTSRGCEMIGTGIGLGLSGFRVNPPGIIPTLDLNFASSLSLTSTSGITPSFSRASTGTYFNSSGVLSSAAINAPRFDHVYNGSSWVSKGLLIEEQRTNIALQSSTLNTSPWTAFNTTATEGAAPSPDGTSNASKLVTTTTNGAHYHYQLIASTAATYTISFYAKSAGYDFVQFSSGIFVDYANFNLNTGTVGNKTSGITASISNVGNGWYRCACTFTSFSGSYDFGLSVINADTASRRPSFAGDGTSGILIYGFQKELGNFSTSAIPTTTASVVRSADVCQITGTDFSGFYNASEGSFACEVNPLGGNTVKNQGIVTANDGTFSNVLGQIRNLQNTNGDYGAFCRASGTTTMSTVRAAGSTQVGVTFRAATGFKTNDCADSMNGGAVITDSTVTLPTVNRLTIGDFHTGANTILNGHIARLRYYNTRLTNSQLQGLTL